MSFANCVIASNGGMMKISIIVLIIILTCATAFSDIYSDCSNEYTNKITNALVSEDWSNLVFLSRKKMTVCESLMSNKDKALTLSSMLIGMNELGQYGEAVSVAKKCIKYDSSNSGCYAQLGVAYFATKEYNKSLDAFKEIVNIGAYNQATEATVSFAKRYIAKIEELSDKGSANLGGNSKSFGSGVFINSRGYIATASHVVHGCGNIAIKHNKKDYHATIIESDIQNDLAVIKIDYDSPFSFIKDNKSVKVGDDVVAVGYPLSGILAAQANVTKGNISSLAGLDNDTRYYQITAPVQQGNSGGPLFDVNGNLIGIITSKLDALRTASLTGDIPQNVNFAVKAYLLTNILDTIKIQYKHVNNNKKATGDKVEQMTNKTVFISCNP